MKPSTLKTLRVLEDNESVTTHDFLVAGCGSRFGARIQELRDLGYRIDAHKLSDRSGSRYRLLGSPEPGYQPTGRHVESGRDHQVMGVSGTEGNRAVDSSIGASHSHPLPDAPGEQAVLFEVPRRNHYEEAA